LEAAGGVDEDVLKMVGFLQHVGDDGPDVEGDGGLADAALLVGDDVDTGSGVLEDRQILRSLVLLGEVER
jgi:hypothetical protein